MKVRKYGQECVTPLIFAKYVLANSEAVPSNAYAIPSAKQNVAISAFAFSLFG